MWCCCSCCTNRTNNLRAHRAMFRLCLRYVHLKLKHKLIASNLDEQLRDVKQLTEALRIYHSSLASDSFWKSRNHRNLPCSKETSKRNLLKRFHCFHIHWLSVAIDSCNEYPFVLLCSSKYSKCSTYRSKCLTSSIQTKSFCNSDLCRFATFLSTTIFCFFCLTH